LLCRESPNKLGTTVLTQVTEVWHCCH